MTMEQLNKQMEQYQKGSLEHCIGMELLELCKGNEGASEIVEQDLAKKGMALSDCAKKIRDYARNHQKGGFFEMDDALSEKLESAKLKLVLLRLLLKSRRRNSRKK